MRKRKHKRSRLFWLPASWRYRLAALKTMDRWQQSWPKAIAAWSSRTLRPRATMLFYPELPPKESVPYKLCSILGYRITNRPGRHVDFSMAWEDETFARTELPPEEFLGARCVNRNCRDISKSAVQQAFREAFGYDFIVDPTRHVGPMLEKADENSVKDAQVVQGPIAREDVRSFRVYERIIDNSTDDGRYVDYRVPVVGNRIPIVMLWYRDEAKRFKAGLVAAGQTETSEALSDAEVAKILEFCGRMGLEYGELDILRDRADGRIYIVDANKTPHGPSSKVTRDEYTDLMNAYVDAFAQMMQRDVPRRAGTVQTRKAI